MPPLLDTPKGQSGRIYRNQDAALQSIANKYPAAADSAMNALGYNSITSQTLTASPSLTLQQPKPATQTANTLGYLDAFSTNLAGQAQQRQAASQDSFNIYLKEALSADTETGFQDKLYTDTVDPAASELNEINDQIRAEQHALRRRIEAIRRNEQGVYASAAEDMISEAENESLSKQADLAIIQLSKQGKYDSAKAIADRAARAMFEKQERKLEALKFNYTENKGLFDKTEQRAFETMYADRERELNAQKQMQMARFEQTLRQSDPLYQAQLAKAQAEAGTTNANPEATAEQLAFLQTTIKDAKDLAGASGASGLSRAAGDWLIGDTKYRQLESLTNTLRTNALVLMTDPSIKKFFGPQMSNADVQLMTSTGTTLNPEKQSPEQMKVELGRLEDLIGRMQTAVGSGQTGAAPTQNLITAPNGDQVIIID